MYRGGANHPVSLTYLPSPLLQVCEFVYFHRAGALEDISVTDKAHCCKVYKSVQIVKRAAAVQLGKGEGDGLHPKVTSRISGGQKHDR